MAKRSKQPKFSDEIRQAIDEAPVSRYQISQATGIDQAALSRFMSGRGGLSLHSVDKLAEYLSWHLKVDSPKQKER